MREREEFNLVVLHFQPFFGLILVFMSARCDNLSMYERMVNFPLVVKHAAARLFYQTKWTIISNLCVSQLGATTWWRTKVSSSAWHSLMLLMLSIRNENMRTKFRKTTVCILLPICLFILHALFVLNREVSMSGSTVPVNKQKENSDFRLTNQFQMVHHWVRFMFFVKGFRIG